MISIRDLVTSESLDREAMGKIVGGLDPFVHTGLRSLMEEMLGWPPLKPEPEVIAYEGESMGGLEKPIVISDRNYTEVTS